jgi:hypothetical protein
MKRRAHAKRVALGRRTNSTKVFSSPSRPPGFAPAMVVPPVVSLKLLGGMRLRMVDVA